MSAAIYQLEGSTFIPLEPVRKQGNSNTQKNPTFSIDLHHVNYLPNGKTAR